MGAYLPSLIGFLCRRMTEKLLGKTLSPKYSLKTFCAFLWIIYIFYEHMGEGLERRHGQWLIRELPNNQVAVRLDSAGTDFLSRYTWQGLPVKCGWPRVSSGFCTISSNYYAARRRISETFLSVMSTVTAQK